VVLTGLLALTFIAGFVLVPLMQSAGTPGALWIRAAYAPLCHQMSERSIELQGTPLAVCARCTGLYLGGALGLFLAAWLVVGRARRPRPSLLAWAVAPTLIDALLPWVGLPGLPNLDRLIVSIPAGTVAGVFLALGVAELFARQAPARTAESFENLAP
jgi:uncharacterized membrane protein